MQPIDRQAVLYAGLRHTKHPCNAAKCKQAGPDIPTDHCTIPRARAHTDVNGYGRMHICICANTYMSHAHACTQKHMRTRVDTSMRFLNHKQLHSHSPYTHTPRTARVRAHTHTHIYNQIRMHIDANMHSFTQDTRVQKAMKTQVLMTCVHRCSRAPTNIQRKRAAALTLGVCRRGRPRCQSPRSGCPAAAAECTLPPTTVRETGPRVGTCLQRPGSLCEGGGGGSGGGGQERPVGKSDVPTHCMCWGARRGGKGSSC